MSEPIFASAEGQNLKKLPLPATHRFKSLDSIRGLAALAVLFGHISGMFIWPEKWIKWMKWPLLNMAFDGRSAVTMFFVLSGFVLAYPYVSGAGARLNVPLFYARRIIRIWLPWFCAFVLALICRCWLFQPFATHPPANCSYWQLPVRWQEVLLQCVFLFHNGPGQILPQDWSLGIELIGSALIPLLVILAWKPLHWLWLSLLAAVLFVIVPQESYFNSGSFYTSFILGVLLARHHGALIAKMKQLKFHHRLFVLLAGVALYQARRIEDHFGYNEAMADQVAWVICSIGCVFIIAASLSSRRIDAFLITRPVLWVGHISYSIYLLQSMVIICFLPPLFAALNRLGFGASPWLLPFSWVCGLTLTLALAWPFYLLVEVPSVNLGRTLSSKSKNK